MKPEQFELIFPLMVIVILVYASSEPSKPAQKKEALFLTEKQLTAGSPKPPFTARQKKWAEKAVRRYAEAQEKNWRNWNEAMFEPD